MTKRLLSVEDCHHLTVDEVHDQYRRYVNPGQVDLMSTFTFGRELAVSADGATIVTRSGRRVLDFTGGLGVLNHGHNHPRVTAVRREFDDAHRMEVHKLFFSPYTAGLSHNLAQLLPGGLEVSFFPGSGAEANEGALKMAYKHHGGRRRFVLHSEISFHGKLFYAGSVSQSPEVPFRFQSIPDTRAYAFDSLSSVEKLVSELRRSDGSSDVYAIMVEPFSASSLRACSPAFLRGLRALCSREDIVLVFDEVYTGWAKAGELFHFMHHDVTPDILTYGKSFGGGKATISGYTSTRRVFLGAYGAPADALLHTSTFNGFGSECAEAIEALNVIVEDDYVGRSKRIHERLRRGLLAVQARHPEVVAEVRGAGSLNGILLHSGPEALKKALALVPARFLQDTSFIDKLLCAAVMEHLYAHHDVLSIFVVNREIPLYLSPPLVVTDEELDAAVDALDRTLARGMLELVLAFVKNRFS